jgi:hypothetical protein
MVAAIYSQTLPNTSHRINDCHYPGETSTGCAGNTGNNFIVPWESKGRVAS